MDTIEITDRDGRKIKMEVVLTFNIETSLDTYIIYKTINKNEYFLGKYVNGSNILDTSLNEQEYIACKKIYEKVVDSNA